MNTFVLFTDKNSLMNTKIFDFQKPLTNHYS